MSKGAGSLPEHSDESDSDNSNEVVELVPKNGSGTKNRKYDNGKFSFCCQPSGRVCIFVLVVTVIVLVLIVVALVIATSLLATSGHRIKVAMDPEFSGVGVPWGNVRLPTSVIPETYDIDLTVNLDSFQVAGLVSIACSVKNSVNYIVLHALDMTISVHSLHKSNGTSGEVVGHRGFFYPANDFFVFDLTNTLDPGPILIAIQFNYTLGDNLAGFYRSYYKNANGQKQYLATTHFEPTAARNAFPCFDEPSFKATFSIHVTHQSRYMARSNMPALNTTQPDPDGMITTHFQTTPRMSTYLVAIVVSDFQCTNDTIVSISGKEILVSYTKG